MNGHCLCGATPMLTEQELIEKFAVGGGNAD